MTEWKAKIAGAHFAGEIDAECIARYEGWVLTRSGMNWSVTHEASGRRLLDVGCITPIALHIFGVIASRYPGLWVDAPFGMEGKAADFPGAKKVVRKARALAADIHREYDLKIERKKAG